ncbi:MAG: recombinase family protein [Gracilibacteraceae bacterium]|jgi:hypothetical protein|nr:recombinase family protein [Gracilibacteraceae bacterium]
MKQNPCISSKSELPSEGKINHVRKSRKEKTMKISKTNNTVADSLKPKAAISYFRVTTRRRFKRGGVNASVQRDANREKAASLGAAIIKEFGDIGASTRLAGCRGLRKMLRYIKKNSGRIDYLIVYKVDRLGRNCEDNDKILHAIKDAGITLVSATEAIDGTPSGMLLHSVADSIAAFSHKIFETEFPTESTLDDDEVEETVNVNENTNEAEPVEKRGKRGRK